ncbi:MAG: Helix-turn-helix domain [Pseudonocardia sp.]
MSAIVPIRSASSAGRDRNGEWLALTRWTVFARGATLFMKKSRVLRLRVHSASRMLRDTGRTVASIAGTTGYGSESAFSTAFKRVMGVSDGEYRLRAANPARGSSLAS